MKICPKCSANVEDNAAFCGTCGAPIGAQPTKSHGVKGRLHCPNCRSTALTSVTETASSTSMATHSAVTKNVAISSGGTVYNNNHFWMCRECGHKFRNVEDLRRELAETKKKEKPLMFLSVLLLIAAAFSVACIVVMPAVTLLFMPLAVMSGILGIAVWVSWNGKKKSIKNMSDDLAYLEVKCFD